MKCIVNQRREIKEKIFMTKNEEKSEWEKNEIKKRNGKIVIRKLIIQTNKWIDELCKEMFLKES